MRIALDAAGREPELGVLVEGAIAALRLREEFSEPIQPVLYGPGKVLREALAARDVNEGEIAVVDSPDIVEMEDQPREVLQGKRGSSIIRAVQDLAEGTVAAFVSMGNTGAVVGSCRAILGRLRWISKPALGIPIPRNKGMGFLIDAGASSDSKPNHLVQFAAMGSVFVEKVYKIAEPRIGLLNIGTESSKGNDLVQDAYRQLSRSPLRFIGNVEGSDIFGDRADVIVTSGFIGNILLKFTESIPQFLFQRLGDTGLTAQVRDILRDLDYSRYGGASLLGVNGTVVVGHGKSGSKAVTRAIKWAAEMAENDLTVLLRDRVFRVRRSLWLHNPFSRGEGSEDES